VVAVAASVVIAVMIVQLRIRKRLHNGLKQIYSLFIKKMKYAFEKNKLKETFD
jgi:hypothetical protein